MTDDEGAQLRAQLASLTSALTAFTAGQVAARPAPTITLRTLFEHFDRVKASELSWAKNRNRLLPLVRRLGDMPASQLTPLAWAEHAAARAIEPHRFGGLVKPHILTVELGRAKELLRFGVASKFLESSPLAEAKAPKTISARETWLDEAGVQALLGGVSEVPGVLQKILARAMILICLDCMMRINEARNLRRDRIKDGVVELSAKATKSKRRRVIGLTPRVIEAIDAIPPNVGNPHLFLNPLSGKLYAEGTLRYWFRMACVASKVDALAVAGERVVVHTLRHSGASAADARGGSPLAIRDALGHASLATTERYLHRHREAGARDLARLMAEGAALEQRRDAQRAPDEARPRSESDRRAR